MAIVNFCLTSLLVFCSLFAVHSQVENPESQLLREAVTSLEKGIAFFYSINIDGGYVYHYTLDLSEKWGEGKTDDRTIEVQPPGTPSVGMSFLQAYRVTSNSDFLMAATDAARALIRGQNELGGWEHKIYLDQPNGERVSFDDDQTQSAIRFLMELDKEIDDQELTTSIKEALMMMQRAQMENGGWPQVYPAKGNYRDYATFNDGCINDCIRVMMQAHRQYGNEEYLESLKKAGDFILISQRSAPQAGWAQQYDENLEPAWARSFEPPAVCPSTSVHNMESLLDLYLYTGNETYLEAIPNAVQWLEASTLPDGTWGRFLELGTNKPLYYNRGRVQVNSLGELSKERRTGYRYHVDMSKPLETLKQRFQEIKLSKLETFPFKPYNLYTDYQEQNPEALKRKVKKIIASQDDQGRWLVHNDRFRKLVPGEKWDGTYREEDRISSRLFNRNVEILCQFLELYQDL